MRHPSNFSVGLSIGEKRFQGGDAIAINPTRPASLTPPEKVIGLALLATRALLSPQELDGTGSGNVLGLAAAQR
jgi:hypothetical protein